MESLFDSLLPLLILLFYLFGNVFRKKKKDKEPQSTEPSYPQPDDQPVSLREEIRRRFEERSRQLHEGREAETDAPLQPADNQEALLPVEPPVSSTEATLRSQHERLEELQRKTDEVWRLPSSRGISSQQDDRSAIWSSVGGIKARLRSPRAIREAVLLREILGTPMALRKSGEKR